jgi:type IV pilus assembly protein PilM
MNLPVYALDISDFSYKYLALERHKNGVVLSDYGEGVIVPGIIHDGEVQQPEALESILRDVFSKKHIRFVAVSLPDEKGYVRPLTLAANNVTEEEIGGALALQLEDYVPLPPSEVLFEYSLLGKKDDHYDIVLRAFPRTSVTTYLESVEKSGATPVLVEPELAAVVRAIVPSNFDGNGMLVDWGRGRASFAFFTKGIVHFTATVPIAGQSLADAIKQKLDVSIEEAVRLKEQDATVGPTREGKAAELFDAIEPIVKSLTNEATRYLQYWQSHSEGQRPPERIYLTGGESHLHGFVEHLAAATGVDVIIADPWVNVPFPHLYVPQLSWKESLRFVSNIGLLLRAADENLYL